MVIYKCDKCGKHLDMGDTLIELRVQDSKVGGEIPDWKQDDIHLCTECYKQLCETLIKK